MTRRIIISLGLLLTVCLVGDAIVLTVLYRSSRELNSFSESHRSQPMRTDLVSASMRMETSLCAYIRGRGFTKAEVLENQSYVGAALETCTGCHHVAHVDEQLEGVRETHQLLGAAMQRLFDNTDAERGEALGQAALGISREVVRLATETVDHANRHLATESTQVATGVRHAALFLLATAIAVFVVGGLVFIDLEKRLIHPVGALLEDVERMCRGEASGASDRASQKEIRSLARGFGKAYTDLESAHQNVLQTERLSVVGRLAAGVAHEVVNPLANISSATQVMRRHGTTKEQEALVKQITAATARIADIVRDLEAFARAPAAATHTRAELVALLRQAAAVADYDRAAAGIDVTCQVDTNVSTIVCDTERMLVVFSQIVVNALDAMIAHGDKQGWLAITAERVGAEVEICFEDGGPGMTDEQIARAFEPFFTTKEPGAGTGMGLWMCYQVIERHNGTIGIRSTPGEGTTVTVRLPCDRRNGVRSESSEGVACAAGSFAQRRRDTC